MNIWAGKWNRYHFSVLFFVQKNGILKKGTENLLFNMGII